MIELAPRNITMNSYKASFTLDAWWHDDNYSQMINIYCTYISGIIILG